MAKNDTIRFDSIPLPETVQEAFLRLPKRWSYVKRKKYNCTKEEAAAIEETSLVLDSTNHAFYIGNYFPETRAIKMQRLLKWGKFPDEALYTEELIAACLDYAFAHLQKGQKAYFVMAGSVGQMLNGPKHSEGALSIEDEIALVYKIAKRKFGKKREDLEVVDLSKDPLHKDLFDALQGAQVKSKDETFIDIEKALGGEAPLEFNKPPTSFQIARCLYASCLANDKFRNIIAHIAPAKLKKSRRAELESASAPDENEEENLARDFYSAVEIGNRLSEILNGRYIHGGADRQDRGDEVIDGILRGKNGPYRNIKELHPLMEICQGTPCGADRQDRGDEVIDGVLSGKNGPYRNIKELHPLMEICQGTPFQTMNVDSKNSRNAIGIKRLRAWARIGLAATLMGVLSLGSCEFGEYRERKKHEKIEARVDKKLENELEKVTFYIEQCYKWPSPQNYNVKNFHELAKRMAYQLEIRYKIRSEVVEELKPHLLEFLLKDKNQLNYFYCDNARLIQGVDSFVRDRKLYFDIKDVKIGIPYEDFLPYINVFRAALLSKEKIVVKESDVSNTSLKSLPLGASLINRPFLQKLGQFSPSDYPWKLDLDLAFYNDGNGHTSLVARHKDFPDEAYTSERGKGAAKEFINAMRKYNNVSLKPLEGLLYAVFDEASLNYSSLNLALDADRVSGEVIKYNDILGQFDYEVTVYPYWNKEKEIVTDCLVARIPGETQFTTARAKEVAKRYFKAQRSHWSAIARGGDDD